MHVSVNPELPWCRYYLSIRQLLHHLNITSINTQKKPYSQHTIDMPIICLGIYGKKIMKDVVQDFLQMEVKDNYESFIATLEIT